MTRIDQIGRGLLLSAFLLQTACSHPPVRPPELAVPPERAPVVAAAPAVNVVPSGKFAIYTLPVGAGNCQVVHCPEQNKVVMMDCGSKGLGSNGWDRDQATTFIRGMIDGGTEVAVTVSHPDGDHYNYVPAVFDGLKVQNLYLGRQLGNYDQTFNTWVTNERTHYAMSVHTSPGFYSSPTPESNLSCWRPDGHGGWALDIATYILGMNAGTTSNDASMVIAMRYGSFQTIFTGDMTAATESRIVAAGPPVPLQSNVITGAHHGSDTFGSNQPSWANATRPQLLMFSAGERFWHPRCTSVNNYLPYVLKGVPPHVYHCGKDGAYERRTSTDAVLVTDDNGLISVEASNDGHFSYSWAISEPPSAARTPPMP